MKKETLATQVYKKIRNSILSGEYQNGDALNENEIAEAYKVSRTPVREAFRRLEKDMIVVSKPGRGVFVIEPSIEDVIEIIQLRMALEGAAVRLATDQADEIELADLYKRFPKIDGYLKPEQYEQAYEAGKLLHDFIVENCNNQRLKELVKNMMSQFEMTTHMNANIRGRHQKGYHEHQAIIQAMLRRDGEAAEAAMRKHLNNVLISFLGI